MLKGKGGCGLPFLFSCAALIPDFVILNLFQDNTRGQLVILKQVQDDEAVNGSTARCLRDADCGAGAGEELAFFAPEYQRQRY